MKSLTYEEALNKIESFMIESGIRDFCTEECQGYCCQKCFMSRKACHRNEKRRLSCSFYLCYNLRDLVFTAAEQRVYEKANMAIKIKLTELMEYGSLGNIYFDVHDENIKEQFSIDKPVLNGLSRINKKAVRSRVLAMRNMHIKLSRLLVNKIKQLEKKNGKDGNNKPRENKRPSR